MKKSMRCLLVTLLLGSVVPLYASNTRLAGLFTDHMVLQREQQVPVWGWADAGEEVVVEFAGQRKSATADADGKWMVRLDPLTASAESRELTVESPTANHKSKITDVLVGDVWLCSGQSNMGWSVDLSLNPEQEIANANYPTIRLFAVSRTPSLAPALDVKGSWKPCSPETVKKFSGVGYFFGRELHKELKIPIGLLQSSVGGTPAEAWTSRDTLQKLPDFGERAAKEFARIQSQEEDNKHFPALRDAWEEKYGVKPPPLAEASSSWAEPTLDTTDWKKVTLSRHWSALAEKTGGVFWIRKEVEIPETGAGKPFQLFLNWISEQYETVFLNGVEIGRASDKAPNFYMAQRRYSVPANLIKAGRNVLAVRIVSATPKAGPWVTGRYLGFPVADAGTINDEWLMKAESYFAPLPAGALEERPKPNNLAILGVSSVLYNGMIAPLIPFGIKGAIWYQGESNTARHAEYYHLLTSLIGDWRARWGWEFPFYIQQLVNNGPIAKEAGQRSSWPYLREAQLRVADTVQQCGIAVGIELGETHNIHPKNKQDVGKRLASVALEKTYGQKIESSGPRYGSMKIENNSIRVYFTHAAGLNARGGPLQRFAIAGADKQFVWADAKIEGDTVIVSSPQVPQPVAVRYAWADNPDGCNLYNQAGLPAFPFRTDISGSEPSEQTMRTPQMYFGDPERTGRPFAKDPSVIRFGGRYLMYYSVAAWAKELAPPGAPKGWAIGIAESRDLINWKKIGEILPEQECEKNGIVNGRIILLDGKLHLFYNTYGNGAKDALCHATSEDGLHFTRNPTNPIWSPTGDWNNGRAIDLDVVEWGDKLILYYATRDPAGKIQMLHAIAAPHKSQFNRADWKSLSDGPVLKPELPWELTCIEAPSVIKRGDTLYLFYGGGYNNAPQQIGCAMSKDGIHFQRIFIDKPLLPNGAPGTWNSSESGHPGLFEDADGQLYMFYQANNDQGRTWYLSQVKIGWDGDKPRIIEPSIPTG